MHDCHFPTAHVTSPRAGHYFKDECAAPQHTMGEFMSLHHRALRASLTAGVAAFAVHGTSVVAAEGTTSMPVVATVVSACVVAATPLAFGNYTSTTAPDTDSESRLVVVCTPGATYKVGLGGGQSQDVDNRKMAGADEGDVLGYSLSKDAAHTENWGNTGADMVDGTGTGTDQVLTVYGRIPAGQAVAVGGYTDVVTVTVSY